MRLRLLPVALALAVASCNDKAVTHEVITFPMPNTASPEKEGQIELTKYAEKVVVTNHTNHPASDCVVVVDDEIRGDLGKLEPRATVTVMRTRFRPYTEADVFYARAKTNTRMECQSSAGPVVIRFVGDKEYTVPVEALIPRK